MLLIRVYIFNLGFDILENLFCMMNNFNILHKIIFEFPLATSFKIKLKNITQINFKKMRIFFNAILLQVGKSEYFLLYLFRRQ